MKKNITKNSLQELWDVLDQADEMMYKALEMAESMNLEGKDDEEGAEINRNLNRIDVTRITSTKNLVESLMNKRDIELES